MVKDQNPKRKMGKDMNRHFTQKTSNGPKRKSLFVLTYNGNAH